MIYPSPPQETINVIPMYYVEKPSNAPWTMDFDIPVKYHYTNVGIVCLNSSTIDEHGGGA